MTLPPTVITVAWVKPMPILTQVLFNNIYCNILLCISQHFTAKRGALGGIPSFFPSPDFSERAVYLILLLITCAFQAVSGRINKTILNPLTPCVEQGPQWTLNNGFLTCPAGGNSCCLFADWPNSLLDSISSGSLLASVQAVYQARGPP